MRKPSARRAMARPIRPNPTIPSRFPHTRVVSFMDPRFAQDPSRTQASPAGIRRAAASSSAQAMSATSSVSTSGVLVTRMPRAFAAARSMASTPTP